MTSKRRGAGEVETPRQQARNREKAESKLRTDGRHCPVCLQQLLRLTGEGRQARRCLRCHAQPQAGRCTHCGSDTVWIAKSRAGCQSCGHHGSVVKVMQGALDDEG